MLERYIGFEPECLRAFNRSFPLFFFIYFLFLVVFTSERGNLLTDMKNIRHLWSDRWKLHGEIQRHAIVITYMFMTNDRCEDTFV